MNDSGGPPAQTTQPSVEQVMTYLAQQYEQTRALQEKILRMESEKKDKVSPFRIPNAKPLPFSGTFQNRPAHELQNYLDDYLNRTAQTCRWFQFAPSKAEITAPGQPTYAQFASGGLTDYAGTKWNTIPLEQQENMTWDDYRQWIMTNFSSKLTLIQAVEALDRLSQVKSAVLYSTKFNEIVSAITAAGVELNNKYLCVRYLQGLKSHLRAMPSLFNLNSDLALLQEETERLDDITFRLNVDKPSTSSRRNNQSQSFRPPTPSFRTSIQETEDHMDLSYVQHQQQPQQFRRLTPEQKTLYRSKGWCVYCQSRDHDVDSCQKLQDRRKLQGFPQQSGNSSTSRGKNSSRDARINTATQVQSNFDEPTVSLNGIFK